MNPLRSSSFTLALEAAKTTAKSCSTKRTSSEKVEFTKQSIARMYGKKVAFSDTVEERTYTVPPQNVSSTIPDSLIENALDALNNFEDESEKKPKASTPSAVDDALTALKNFEEEQEDPLSSVIQTLKNFNLS